MGASAIGAGISAVGSVAGGVASGKGAAKAAKIQAQTTDKILDAVNGYYTDAENRYSPEVNYGNSALDLYNSAIGNGTSTDAAANAYSTFQNSIGYQDTLNDALNSTNASAYSSGMGRSGAAEKALQDRAASLAQQTYQNWLGDVNTSVQTGEAAKNAVTSSATTALGATTGTLQNAGTASANAALSQGATTASTLNTLGNLASNAYTSSYGNSGIKVGDTTGINFGGVTL